jgi:SAM-dependent methyltransferase
MQKYFDIVARELADEFEYMPNTQNYLRRYYENAGFQTKYKHNFFHKKYIETLGEQISFLEEKFPNKLTTKIVDLGAGSGTQSLILAELGFQVVAFDLSQSSIDIILERKVIWEKVFGKTLNIQTYTTNTVEFKYETIAPIDALISVFAWNMMYPYEVLLENLLPAMNIKSALIIQDGNADHFIKKYFFKRKSWTPKKLANVFEDAGYEAMIKPNISMPPIFWALFPSITNIIDQTVSKAPFAPTSNVIYATKS